MRPVCDQLSRDVIDDRLPTEDLIVCFWPRKPTPEGAAPVLYAA